MALVLRRLVPLVLLALFWVPAASAWSWPVPGPVLQPFSFDPAHPYAAGQHRGTDVGAPAGSGVVAPAAGTVGFAGSVPTSGTSLTIVTADGYSVTLTHLGTLAVARGATVAEGDVVGTVGPSGTPELDEPYVHLGIRLAGDPNGYLDPLTLLPALVPPAPASADASAVPAAPVAPVAPPASPAETAPASPGSAPAQSNSASVATEPEAATPAQDAPVATRPATAAPVRTPAARVSAAPATVRRPETRSDRQGRPVPAPVRSTVRRSDPIAHAPGRARAARRPEPVVLEPLPLRHRPVRVSPPASSRERPGIAETRPSVVPLALGTGMALLALAALAGVLRLRRPTASPSALGAVVIPLPRRPDRLGERRVA